MDQDNITPGTLPADGGEGAVDEVVQTPDGVATPATPGEGLTLEDFNSLLGKDFKDIETAKKSLKDTQSFVGKKANDVEKDLKDQGYMSKSEFENMMFFRDNPEHAGNQAVLEAIAAKENITLAEAAKNESYVKLHEGAANYEKSESLKSVLNPSPRLQQAQEKVADIQKLQSSGNSADAQALAAKTVAEAFGIEL